MISLQHNLHRVLDLEIEVIKISCFCKMEICLCVCDMIIGRYGGNCVCGMSWRQIVLLSCLCFAEMSIYFRFGEFRAKSRSIYVLFLGKVMPNFFMTLMHACILIINLFIITVQSSRWSMERWWTGGRGNNKQIDYKNACMHQSHTKILHDLP